MHGRKKEGSMKEQDSINSTKANSGKSKRKKSEFSKSEMQRMLLSSQTREGLRITGKVPKCYTMVNK